MEQRDQPDYYELLQVSRRADPLIITKAYRLLASIYHPDNKETGNEDKFSELVDAYRHLVDPVRRAAYDRVRFGADRGSRSFTSQTSTDGHPLSTSEPAQDERHLRRLVLHALYNVRRNRPYSPGLPLLVIAELLDSSIEEAQFTLWYLRGKKLIETIDDDALAITVAGVDYLEANSLEEAPALPPIALPQHVAEIPPRPKAENPAASPPDAD